MRNKFFAPLALVGALLAAPVVSAATLTLYSGRGESLVQPLVSQFEQQTGIKVNVRYGDTAQLAVLLQEEGRRSPADVYWGQDAGAMGAVSQAGLLASLPADVYENLPGIYKSVTGNWVATSGRARLLVHSLERAPVAEHPRSVFDLTDAQYRGRVGWAPTNGSFQSFVTGMRVTYGDEKTLEWLNAMKANGVKAFRNNGTIIQGVADGEIDYGLTNNYYLPRQTRMNPNYPVGQVFFADGDIGNLMNVAGAAVVKTSRKQKEAAQLVRFLISAPAQEYFSMDVNEYPVIPGVTHNPHGATYDQAIKASPSIDLDKLSDLEGTLNLLRRAGLI
ncbi:iron ABC transporter substrate-binding protein [Marinospirillum alkaliphilum]|uniref:Iron(III) transport system substrate-binding protein n=1 Tax=Marinospirillum alkaliphilum DSM 21637 TaxID=1122209 RepID=A0A1K1UZQ5_9GAMM|nr:iron ABC transporter substrate-binding protein [Marinospirillum alkaliphilum]SFX17797.1 iron(III) transport system substrate-binding protein [Marinospirillum alkaliphilum DSM 21637]